VTSRPPSHHPAGNINNVLSLSSRELTRPIAAPTHSADHISGLSRFIISKSIETLRHRTESNVNGGLNVTVKPLVVFAHIDKPNFTGRFEEQEFVH